MSQSTRIQSAPLTAADVFRWVGTKNPFYAISAALVLSGLWVSFGKPDEAVDTWLLMSGLAGYTVLLAVTAYVLVRYLKVWDDARTVLLVVVLLFLATSVTFDPVLAVNPSQGQLCYLVGLGLSVLISEAVLRGIQLRLPALYRVPYYLLLGLFFLYPILVRWLLDPSEPMAEPMLWGLFGFSTAGGLIFLTLLPGVRRGAKYVGDNGPHLVWPAYPWSLFAVFAVAVPGRAILLCWSLHWLDNFSHDRLVFGPYFLVPFALALGVLALEMGFVLRRKALLRFSLAVPLVLIGLALIGHSPSDPVYRALRVLTVPLGERSAFGEVRLEPDPVYGQFLQIFSQRLGGDPLFITWTLAAAFYLYAAARRVPWALDALAATVLAKVLIGTDTLMTGRLAPPTAPPLLLAAGLLLGLGAWRRDAWRILGGAACLAGFVGLAVPGPLDGVFRPAIFIHLVLLAMLVIGAVFSDPMAMFIRRLAAVTILVLSLAVMREWFGVPRNILPEPALTYPLIMGIVLGLYAHLLRHSFSMAIATLILGYWFFRYGWSAYRTARLAFPGLNYLVPGLAFFVVAVLVSLGKSGLLRRWIEPRWTLPRWLLAATSRPAPATAAALVVPPLALSADGGSAVPEVPPASDPPA